MNSASEFNIGCILILCFRKTKPKVHRLQYDLIVTINKTTRISRYLKFQWANQQIKRFKCNVRMKVNYQFWCSRRAFVI